MSTNLEYRTRERSRKKESRRRPAKLDAKKGDTDREREIKTKGDIFFAGEQDENLVAGDEKC